MDPNVIMLRNSIILLLISITTVFTACICRESGLQAGVPMWEAPCGMKIVNEDFDESKPDIDQKVKRSMIMKSLKEIKQNLKLCSYFYQRQNYSLMTHHMKLPKIFKDDWLPTGQEVRKITVTDIQTIPKIELILYTMLQKYAMMFTEMLTDDNDFSKQKFVKKIISDLKSLLCDVQSSLIWLEERPLQNPGKIPQKYLYKGSTEKHLRDIEVISKYGDFLKQWLKWIRNTRRQFRRNKNNRQNS